MSFPDAIEQRRRVSAYLEKFPAEREAVDDVFNFVWGLGCGIYEFYRVIGEAVESGEPISAAAWEELKARARVQWPEDLIRGCQIGHRHDSPWKSDLLENGSVSLTLWFIVKLLAVVVVVVGIVVPAGLALRALPERVARPLMRRLDRALAAVL